MKSNKDLTVSEFIVSQRIKRAMIYIDDVKVRDILKDALRELYA